VLLKLSPAGLQLSFLKSANYSQLQHWQGLPVVSNGVLQLYMCWQGCINNTTSSRKLVRFSFPAAFAGGPRGGSAESQVHLLGSFTGWQVRG